MTTTDPETIVIGKDPAQPAQDDLPLKDRIVKILKGIYDPEIPVDIYELGLIYDIGISPENDIAIKMTLTTPACPVAGTLPPEVEKRIKTLPDVKDVKVEIVWEPPWKMDKMSDAAKLKLGMM